MTLPAILITGGATRIGAEIARGFSDAGWHVVIHFNSSSGPAEKLAGALLSAETVQCDLSDDNAAVSMIEGLANRLPNWRCLINSASVFRYDGATNLDPVTNRQAMQVNALAPARMTQAFFAHALSSIGRCVIQITDMKIANSNPDFFSYTMSKHALASTIGMLAKEHLQSDDRIYGIAPGAILASHDQSEEETEISHRLNLLKRKTNAGEIVDAALFLSTGKLRSGETLYIDSGQHLLDQERDVIWLAREKAKSGKVRA